MKIDAYFPPDPPENAVLGATEAASRGFDGFFTSETRHDPFLPLVLAAGASTDLDLGTAIAVAFARSPMVTAMTSWDLARLSGGRFILGLGTQVKPHITRRFGMDWERPTDHLRDYIGAVRAIWETWENGSPLRYNGEFYRLSLMTPFFDPGPIGHEIPIFIAGVGPVLSRLAGEVADGFHIHPFHTVPYLESVVIPGIESGALDTGRNPGALTKASAVFVVTGEKQHELEKQMVAVKQQIAFYASTPSYRPVLEASGWDFGEQLNTMSRKGQWEEMAGLITDDVVSQVGVVAPLDDLGDAIANRYRGLVDRLGIYTLGSESAIPDGRIGEVIAALKSPSI